MKCLRMRIVDQSVLKLIRMWLEAPVEEDDGHGGKNVSRSGKGTPQGGVIHTQQGEVLAGRQGCPS